MSADRTISSKLPTSPSVNACSLLAHAVWPHTAYIADPWGRFESHPGAVRASMFPLRDDVTMEMVESWLQEWARCGMIEIYFVNGRRYAQIVEFDTYQKATVSYRKRSGIRPKLPAPPHEPEVPATPLAPTLTQEPAETPQVDTAILKAAEEFLGRFINHGERQQVFRWQHVDKYAYDWIAEAFSVALERGKRKLSYVDGILRSYSAEGGPRVCKPRIDIPQPSEEKWELPDLPLHPHYIERGMQP
jgi:DnaD/phage-associated family protein